ncbi:hypothetical protein DL96DRAFT_245329 [Flagelloscypha sp. PMI_526]|nr:hypothetical protein DL96DRAFT_245329 [Flagelloscypha sp. PMI_526]
MVIYARTITRLPFFAHMAATRWNSFAPSRNFRIPSSPLWSTTETSNLLPVNELKSDLRLEFSNPLPENAQVTPVQLLATIHAEIGCDVAEKIIASAAHGKDFIRLSSSPGVTIDQMMAHRSSISNAVQILFGLSEDDFTIHRKLYGFMFYNTPVYPEYLEIAASQGKEASDVIAFKASFQKQLFIENGLEMSGGQHIRPQVMRETATKWITEGLPSSAEPIPLSISLRVFDPQLLRKLQKEGLTFGGKPFGEPGRLPNVPGVLS